MDSGNHPFVAVLDELIRAGTKNVQLKIRGDIAPVGGSKLSKSSYPGVYELTSVGMLNQRPVNITILVAAADVAGIIIPEQESQPVIMMPS